MITETDHDDYVQMLKNCSMLTLLQMNDMIAKELSRRYETKYFLPQPHNEIVKLRTFMETVDRMLGFPKNKDKQDISEFDLIDVLNLNGFSNMESKQYIKKAMSNGQIYESRAGHFAKP